MEVSTIQTERGSKAQQTESAATLADFVFTLRAGSRCFCCGSTLMPSLDDSGSRRLVCDQCGAGVEDVEGLRLQQAA